MPIQNNNRLQYEHSLYLKQHAHHPVDWHAFNAQALQKAIDAQKPLFLSIGYSTCHWCHVMAHESFENQQIAQYLNENFVCIKVDKEEYPDLDQYFQQACHLFSQSGGWPLSVFTLPDLKPFFVGTYFPPYAKGNQIGFYELLQEMMRAYTHDHDKVVENAAKAVSAIDQGLIPKDKVRFEGHFPGPTSVFEAIKDFRDNDHGGHGGAPKFPNFSFLEWGIEQILERMVHKGHDEHLIMTLNRILFGGLYDHVKGGVHRYCVDQEWKVPHFEKMLYDQAGFLSVLAKASILYPAPHIFDSIIQTLEYLEHEMLGENGYFFTAQDADSEGVEGLYFTFSKNEFLQAIENHAGTNIEDFEAKKNELCAMFSITEEGHFEDGQNVISLNPMEKEKILSKEGWELVRQVKQALWEERKQRIPPATDTKGLASHNFMILTALCDVVQYCPIEAIKNMAHTLIHHCFEGIFSTFVVPGNQAQVMTIRHTTTKEDSLLYFEDYAFFSESQLRLYEISGNDVFKDNAQSCTQAILTMFKEKDHFFTRAKEQTSYVPYPNRPYSSFDSSYKSASSTFATVLRRLSVLELNSSLNQENEEFFETLTHEALKNPLNAGQALRALTYPLEAYRVFKLPKNWCQNNEFLSFTPYFLPRFVLSYVDLPEQDQWQICSLNECELQGTGIEQFKNTLFPKDPELDTEL